MSLCNLKLCTHIWSTNINFRPPPYIGLFGLSWSELSPYAWIWREGGEEGGSIGPPTFFVMDGQKRDYLSRASRALLQGGVTKNGLPQFPSVSSSTCSEQESMLVGQVCYGLEMAVLQSTKENMKHWPNQVRVNVWEVMYRHQCHFLQESVVSGWASANNEFIPGLPFPRRPGFPAFFIPEFPRMKTHHSQTKKWEWAMVQFSEN